MGIYDFKVGAQDGTEVSHAISPQISLQKLSVRLTERKNRLPDKEIIL